jgi:hypothetical protein
LELGWASTGLARSVAIPRMAIPRVSRGAGPQGDAIRINNFARLVREAP